MTPSIFSKLRAALCAGALFGSAAIVACGTDNTAVNAPIPEAGLNCGDGAQVCGGACTSLAHDVTYCGACGNTCKAGEVCSSGKCATSCGGGSTQCGSACVTLGSDGANCGACGAACKAGEVCSAGKCTSGCSGGTEACGQSCVNTQTDRTNCGACGTLCKDGEICTAGACSLSCQQGLTTCRGNGDAGAPYCASLQTDNANCGVCGNVCPNGQSCSAGKCTLVCGGGTTQCGNACVDVKNDPANCGVCNNVCANGLVCSGGVCQLACSGGTVKCGNVCVDTQNDPSNCGVCGNVCANGLVCSGGMCQLSCLGGSTKCGNLCVDIKNDPANCGMCGTMCAYANAGAYCGNSVCGLGACNAGFANCNKLTPDGCEIATTTDPNNCGGCGVKCAYANAGATCGNSTCGLGACNAGFANCNNNALDGCEVATTSDINNCGGCGTKCSNANGSPSCSNSACSIACNAGYANCNNNAADGCEVNTTSDVNNCGGCGIKCGNGATCVAGVCKSALCGNKVVDPSEEYDPAPGPFSSAVVDAVSCRWHFESVTQLYCNGSCSWAGAQGCDQADADIFCKLRTGSSTSTASSFTTGTASAQPGFPCSPLGYGVVLGNGSLPLRGVANLGFSISYQDTSILANHGAGAVISGVTCTP